MNSGRRLSRFLESAVVPCAVDGVHRFGKFRDTIAGGAHHHHFVSVHKLSLYLYIAYQNEALSPVEFQGNSKSGEHMDCKMSNGEVRKVSLQDIQLVQNLIERCLQLYMGEREVVSTLLHQAKIEPDFTQLVWQKLEVENRDFFRAYHLRLIVKDQITRFNQLLERQIELMRHVCQTGVASIPMYNGGSQIRSTRSSSAYPSIKNENMNQPISNISNAYANGASFLRPQMLVGSSDANMLETAQDSNTRMMIKSEDGYGDESPFMFGADNNNLLEAIEESPVSHFNGNVQEMNSFGFLGQIPRNFSLSDLTAGFSNSTDILESYSRSPFLGSGVGFLKDEQEDIQRLDTISEGLSNEDFGSD